MRVIPFIYLATKPFQRYIALPIFNMIMYAGCLIGHAVLIKNMINAAHTADTTTLIYNAILLSALELAMNIIWRLNDWAQIKYVAPLRNNITQLTFARLAQQSHLFFQNNFAGALTAKVVDLVTTIPIILWTLIGHCLLNAVLIGIAIITIAQISMWIALGLLLWAVIFLALSFVTLKRFNYLATRNAQAGSRLIAAHVDTITNMLGVRLFSHHNEELKIINKTHEAYAQTSQRRRWFTLKLSIAQSTGFSLYLLACMYILISLRLQGRITPGDFGFILTINLGIINHLWQLSEQMRQFSDQWGMAEEALKTIYAPLPMHDAPDAQPLHASHGAITFEHVCFEFAKNKPLFNHTNIVIPAGQKVGLVGFSGSGKTTFANLMLRLYDLTSGQILIDGQDIALVTQNSLRKAIAFVPQEPSLFHRSVRENIAYGSPDATEDDIKSAAYKASAHDFIMHLPQQYDTIVGERGTKLSGGQRQRIALARALLKKAPILILDEATSQLDTITEKNIQSALADYFESGRSRAIASGDGGQTTLVIAHRLSTLLYMDRILVFDNGRIVQDGSHAQLLTQEGLYKTLWQAQTNFTH
ncbi:MAG: transporter ATP-binding protein/permease [Candidatus Dependentiae bacterium]|nr:transporter ATP-binding protein/permease [Candidatus Dependentiae bacterium]